MELQDHASMLQWIDEAVDGELDASRRAELDSHLGDCASCREAQESLLRLQVLLTEDRVEVAPGFTKRVIGSLPIEAWEARPARSLRWAVALLALLATSSLLLLSGSGAAQSAPFALLGSITDLMTTGMLAGAGLLGATWRGVGLILQDLLTGSPATFAVFAATVVAIHLLLFRLLRSRRKTQTASLVSGDSEPRS